MPEEGKQIVLAAASMHSLAFQSTKISQWKTQEVPSSVELLFSMGDKLWKQKGRIWIPSDDRELQHNVLLILQCGVIGHRGIDTTLSMLVEDVWWQSIKGEAKSFVNDCLHFIMKRTDEVAPRLLGHALHGDTPT